MPSMQISAGHAAPAATAPPLDQIAAERRGRVAGAALCGAGTGRAKPQLTPRVEEAGKGDAQRGARPDQAGQ